MAFADSFLPDLLDQLPTGAIALDRFGRVVHVNKTEERLARRRREQLVGKRFFEDVAPCMNVRELAGAFHDRIGRAPLAARLELGIALPHSESPREVVAQLTSFEIESIPYALLTLEDVAARRAMDWTKEALSGLLLHDLKSPLAAALAHLQLLTESAAVRADRDAQAASAEAERAARRLERALSNLLALARLETDNLPLRRQPTDLRALAASAASSGGAAGRLRGIEVVAELPHAEVRAEVDPEAVRAALGNLVDNAVRHAKQRVVVRARDGGIVEVSDDGPGVPEPLRDRLFEQYEPERAAQLGFRPLQGLGLRYVRLVARAHGTDAEVESPLAGGAVFRIRFP